MNYRLDPVKKTITIDDTVKATAADQQDLAMYVAAGYIIKHKSQKRAKQAAERAKQETLTDAAILEALKDDEDGLNKYNSIKTGKGQGHGFFAAKKWYKTEYKK